MSASSPKPTGAVAEYDLFGAYLPLYAGHLVVVYFEEHGASYVLIFSTQTKLEDGIDRAGLPWDSCSVIDNPDEFLASVREHGEGHRLAMDLRVMPDGKVRFHEIVVPR